MLRRISLRLMIVLAIAAPAFASVSVTTPSNGASVSNVVPFVATAGATTCAKGVASMGIYVDNAIQYVVNGTKLNTTVAMTSGKHNAVVQAWDYCGGATTTAVALTVTNATSVSVTLPASGSTVSSPVAFIASGATSCAKGVSAIGVYVNGTLAYKTTGSTLNAQVAIPAGAQQATVEEWDNCGETASTLVNLTVASNKVASLQAAPGWNQWGELPPNYAICSAPCNGVSWSMKQGVSSTSLSGNATQFSIAGTAPYSDVLWSNPVIGQGNKQNLTDASHTLIPTLHNFSLDSYVYVTNLAATQDLEFDINMYENGVGMEWGTECNHLADGVWDIWNNVEAAWVPTSIPCTLNNQAWNHVTLQVQREANNVLLYQSITVNGVTSEINQTVQPFSVPTGWWGMTVNFQMDGNSKMASNTTYVDNTTFTYW